MRWIEIPFCNVRRYRRMAQTHWQQQQPQQNPQSTSSLATTQPETNEDHAQQHGLHSKLLLALQGQDAGAIELAARLVLQGSKDLHHDQATRHGAPGPARTALQAGQPLSVLQAGDEQYLEEVAQLLLAGPAMTPNKAWGKKGQVSEAALVMMLEAVSELMGSGVTPLQLAGTRNMLPALVRAVEQGAPHLQASGMFLLSQIALAGPATAVEIAALPGLPEACYAVIIQQNSSETLTNPTALLLNNLAALGGEDAVRVLSAHGKLVRELAACLDNAHDAATLQRLTGVFNHLSRSPVHCAAPLTTTQLRASACLIRHRAGARVRSSGRSPRLCLDCAVHRHVAGVRAGAAFIWCNAGAAPPHQPPQRVRQRGAAGGADGRERACACGRACVRWRACMLV